jgi:hypothetical protein
VIPLRTSAEAVEKMTRAVVGALQDAAGAGGRERPVAEPSDPLSEPAAGLRLF